MGLKFSRWEDGTYKIRKELEVARSEVSRAEDDLRMGRTREALERVQKFTALFRDIEAATRKIDSLVNEEMEEIQR